MFVAVFSVPDKSLPVGGPRPNTAPSERHRCVQYHTMSPASLSPPTTAYLKLNFLHIDLHDKYVLCMFGRSFFK